MGFYDKKPKKKGGLFGNLFKQDIIKNGYKSDAWRKDIPCNDANDSHIWDWPARDRDNDGYRDDSVGDSDLWDN